MSANMIKKIFITKKISIPEIPMNIEQWNVQPSFSFIQFFECQIAQQSSTHKEEGVNADKCITKTLK